MDVSVFGKPTTSDPYVIVRLGRDVWKSPVVLKSLNPIWAAPAGTRNSQISKGELSTAHLSLYDDRQHLDFNVFDQDTFSSDDCMGKSLKMPARGMFVEGTHTEHEVLLTHEGKNAGHLNISTDWFLLSKLKPVMPTMLYVAVKVKDVIGLSVGSVPPFTLVVKFTKDIEESMKSRAVDPMALRPVGDALQQIIAKMDKYGLKAKQIADCVSLKEEQVKYVQQLKDDPGAAKLKMLQASAERQATVPAFNRIIRALVPWTAAVERTGVVVSLLDKKGKQVGSNATINFSTLVQAEDMEIQGPFMLSKEILCEGAIRASWLAPS